MKAAKGAVAFVALSNKIFAAPIPVCVGAENRNFGANIMRRMSPPSRKTCAVIAEVVVLPCIPAMTMPRLARMIAARASARRTTGFPRIAPGHENWIVAFNCR